MDLFKRKNGFTFKVLAHEKKKRPLFLKENFFKVFKKFFGGYFYFIGFGHNSQNRTLGHKS